MILSNRTPSIFVEIIIPGDPLKKLNFQQAFERWLGSHSSLGGEIIPNKGNSPQNEPHIPKQSETSASILCSLRLDTQKRDGKGTPGDTQALSHIRIYRDSPHFYLHLGTQRQPKQLPWQQDVRGCNQHTLTGYCSFHQLNFMGGLQGGLI